jgi:hypothetical protein
MMAPRQARSDTVNMQEPTTAFNKAIIFPFVLASLFCDSKHCGLLVFRGRCRRENRSSVHDDFLVLLKSEAGERLFKLLVRRRPERFPGLTLFWSRRNCRIWRHDRGEVAQQRREKDGSGLWSWRETARDDTKKLELRNR